ncbi:syntaxin-related protein KNOLLE-like [Alnus glutinosa]|uniref:syntaxin-related protein KNOLLE-like n=1 Tax=Alnus glutinosa TaxID=3517 RepID=UPI002D76BE5B|nr:syntaxin-related protein KNOLLE-like [Alnus glutinosa]
MLVLLPPWSIQSILRGSYFSNDATSSSQPTCQICGKLDHTTLRCYQRQESTSPSESQHSPQAYYSSPALPNEDNWYPDTRVTHHVTSELQHLNLSTEDYHGQVQIRVGDRTGLPITHIGSTSLTLTRRQSLLKQLHVPLICKNLLSIRKFALANSKHHHIRANVANKRLSGSKEGTPIYRTRIAVTNGLRKKLKELMMDFQGLRQRMMFEYKDTVGRRYFTVTGEYPDEEVIDKIISNGGKEFLGRAVQEHGRGKVLETVVEIQDRHDAAKEIEKSLLELHQVFLDMAVMVEAQAEQMDDIEHHVMNAAHYVKDGSKDLKTAVGYQRNSRKWMCAGLILLLVLILVVVIPIVTSFSNS